MPSDFIDDNGVSNFIDDLDVTLWVDDNGLFLGDSGTLTLTALTALIVMSGRQAGLYYTEHPIDPGPGPIDPGPGPIESNRLNPGPIRFPRPKYAPRHSRFW